LCFFFLFLHTFFHFLSCSFSSLFHISNSTTASRSGRAVWSLALRPLACWNCGFESGWCSECLPLVLCRQVEVSATGRSLVQKSPADCMCGCELCMIYKPQSQAVSARFGLLRHKNKAKN
jgi:hypothetical protein